MTPDPRLDAQARLLTAYGTLYRALGRLEKMGILESRWEDPAIPARENRPGRRLYRLTAAGETATMQARAAAKDRPRRGKERLAPVTQMAQMAQMAQMPHMAR